MWLKQCGDRFNNSKQEASGSAIKLPLTADYGGNWLH